jgi:gliding motility-associated-like protein
MFKKIYLALYLIVLTAKSWAVPFTDKGAEGLLQVYNSCAKAADINNDGLMDILLSGYDGTYAYTRFYLNNGNFSFTPLSVNIPDLSQARFDWCDFNNDGYVDLVISGVTSGLEKICRVYKNNGDSTFTEVQSGIENVAYGSVLWADFDNDGKPDLFTTGVNEQGQWVAHIYKNVNDSFVLMPTNISGISSGAAVTLDFNNDGKTDLLIAGLNQSGQKVTLLYENKGNFVFESVNTVFEKISDGDIACGDVDGNGYDDVILTGNNASGKKITKLYLNNNGVFSEATSAVFDSLSGSSVDLADFNNDGLPDVLLTGLDNQLFYKTTLYINNGDNTFSKDPSVFPGLIMADAAIADFDNDADLDIFLSGETYTENIGEFFSNDEANANHKPSAPTGLTAVSKNDSVVLNWNKATDNETPQNGLTYNLYVGTQPGKCDIVSPMSFIPNGLRKLPKAGNMFHNSTFILKNLAEGKYYWGVQSIDNNYAGSNFSTEGTFTVCHNLNIGNDTSACYGDTIQFHAGKLGDVVNWYSIKHGLLISGSQTLNYIVKEDDKIVVQVNNTLGCTLYDTVQARVIALPSFSIGKDTSLCFGSDILLNAGSGWKTVNWYSQKYGFLTGDTSEYKYTALVNDTIYAEAISNTGCRNYDSIYIASLSLPSFSVGYDTGVCYNDTASLHMSPVFQNTKWYTIHNILLSSGNASYSYIVNQTDTIYAEVTDTHGCKNSDTIIVNKLQLPSINIGRDTAVCFDNQLPVHAIAAPGHINWYSANEGTIASDTSSIKITVVADNTLWAVITDKNSCMNSDTIKITKLNLPDFTIGNDTSVCKYNDVLLNAGTGWKRVDWYDNSSGLLQADSWFYNHQVISDDTIWAKVTDYNNCINTDSVHIISWQLPAFSLGNDTALCKDQFIMLDAGSNWLNVSWNSVKKGLILNGNQTLDYQSVMSDTIWAVVTDNHLCSNSDTIIVTTLGLPQLNLEPAVSVCYNDSLHISAGDGWKTVNWHSAKYGLINTNSSEITRVITENDTLFAEVLNNNNCLNYDTTVVTVIPLPVVNLGRDTDICLNQEIVFHVPDSLRDVNWYSSLNGLISSGNKTFKYRPLKSDTISVKVLSNAGCTSFDSLVIVVNPLPAVNAGPDTMLCYNESLTLGGNPTAKGTNNNFNYYWKPEGAFSNNRLSNPSITVRDNVIYYLRVTDSNSCIATDSIIVSVNPPSQISLAGDTSVCLGQSVQLGVSPVVWGSLFPYTYHWWPDSTIDDPSTETPLARPSTNTKYRLVLSTWHCSPDTAYVTLVVRPLPIVHVNPTLTIGEDGFVQLYAEGGTSYYWTPQNSLNQSNIQNPIAKPEVSTLYTVTVTDSFGCSSEDTVQVNVKNEVFVPNLFTPNNDGRNDYFKVYGFGFMDLSLTITDRQNNIVYESIDMNEITQKGWDGTYKGKPLETGIYRWSLNGHFLNGEIVLYKGKNSGIVTLIR